MSVGKGAPLSPHIKEEEGIRGEGGQNRVGHRVMHSAFSERFSLNDESQPQPEPQEREDERLSMGEGGREGGEGLRRRREKGRSDNDITAYEGRERQRGNGNVNGNGNGGAVSGPIAVVPSTSTVHAHGADDTEKKERDWLQRQSPLKRACILTGLWLACLLLFIGTVYSYEMYLPSYGSHWMDTFKLEASFGNPAVVPLLISLRLPGFALGYAIFLWLCFTPHGGFVKVILELPIFTVLGRLTFGAYLVHPTIIYIRGIDGASSMIFSPLSGSLDVLTNVMLAYLLAAVFFLLIEQPLANVQRACLRM